MLVDCAFAAGRGAGRKKISFEAAQFWAKGYKKTFAAALNNGADFESDRDGVLLMGVKLGRRARDLAGTNPVISRANAKKASKEISLSIACGAGGGQYCPPGNFDF
jgi:hypothetical protein